MKHTNHFWGGVMGFQILQNRSEIRINTAQNNFRKPQNNGIEILFYYPNISEFHKPLGFVKSQDHHLQL